MMFADCPPITPLFLWPTFCLVYSATTIGFTIALVSSLWRQRTGRDAQQVGRRRLCATLVLWGPIVIRFAVPCPIQGDYVGNMTACKCDLHEFVTFSGGGADFFFSGHDNHEHWGGYQKTGWNTYVLREDGAEEFPVTLHTGWLFLTVKYAPESRHFYKEDWLLRDFLLFRWMP